MPNPNKVQKVLDDLVKNGHEIGVQVAAYLDGKPVIDAWAGHADEATNRPVDGETLFTATSVSKGITATCVHILADRGVVNYDTPIAKYWPEFAANGKGRATIRDALTHRVGIPQDPPGFDLTKAGDWAAVCRATAQLKPQWEPGTQTGYHALTYGWMLGEVLRRVDGRPIDQFLQDEVCRPLGIEGMYFGVPAEAEARVATLKNVSSLGPINAPWQAAGVFNRSEVRRAVIPGAGLIVNARALARHYAMLADGGELDGVRILSQERVAIATKVQFDGKDSILSSIFPSVARSRWSLGYSLGGRPGPMQERPDAFGYEGVGTIGFADPSKRFSFAFLKNLLDMSPKMNWISAALAAQAVADDLENGFDHSE